VRVAVLCLLTACAQSHPLPAVIADSAVREFLDVRYYRVSGGVAGTRGGALTTWDVQYDYSATQERAGCRLEKPHVTLGVRQSLPIALGADPAVDLVILNGVDVLRQHEEGHLRIDREGANRLAQALRAVPPQRDCKALADAARAAAMKAIDECRAANDAYDAATQHGTSGR
jgi:predicted secreted Zn-dependent protease